MGSFRFRRSIKIAPGVRLNVSKRSVGVSAGVRGARFSINSSGRRTRSIGIPGTGLSYRSQSGPARRRRTAPSRGRALAHSVGGLVVALFVVLLVAGAPSAAAWVLAIGGLVWLLLRVVS